MGGIQRVTNKRQGGPSTGKTLSTLAGAVIGGMLGGMTGNPLALVKGVIGGAEQGSSFYDMVKPSEPVNPYAGLGPTAQARLRSTRRVY